MGSYLMSTVSVPSFEVGNVMLTHPTEYLDSDNSGTHTDCVTDNISSAFQPLANWLRENKRQAINSETGGGNTASCQKYLCQQIQFLKSV